MVQKTAAMDLRGAFPSYLRIRKEKELGPFASVSGGQRPFAWALAVRTDDQTTRQHKSVAISGVMPIAQRSNAFHKIHFATRFSCSAAP
jgi:hypothetical protein